MTCLDKSNGNQGKEIYKIFILAGTFQEQTDNTGQLTQSLDSDLLLFY